VIGARERSRDAAITELPLTHLASMTDGLGLFEHADRAAPRPEHGYCLDDVARGLIVVVRGDVAAPHTAASLLSTYLRFTEAAVGVTGRAHNRLNRMGAWTDEPGLGDWWGRAVHALGVVAATAADPAHRRRARVAFDRAAQRRSPHLRATALAMLGAAEVLADDPGSESARMLLVDGAAAIPEAHDAQWPWPEPRLGYGNAAIAEALLAAGTALEDPRLSDRGLTALAFLVRTETRDGHLSVTGVGGRGPGEHEPQFDQQPIEVAAIADACARAHRSGSGPEWEHVVRMCWAWFLGDNDTGVMMIDPETGAGFDGLEPDGRNENRGAESTLAALTSFHRMRALSASGTP
jgi:hypothetical protein